MYVQKEVTVCLRGMHGLQGVSYRLVDRYDTVNIIAPVTLFESDHIPSRLSSCYPPEDVTLSSPYIRTIVSLLIHTAYLWFRLGQSLCESSSHSCSNGSVQDYIFIIQCCWISSRVSQVWQVSMWDRQACSSLESCDVLGVPASMTCVGCRPKCVIWLGHIIVI